MKAIQDGGLAARQAISLLPDLREAFNYPIRRQIVRTIQEQQGKMTGQRPSAHVSVIRTSLSRAQYHAAVLLSRGILAADGVFPTELTCTSTTNSSQSPQYCATPKSRTGHSLPVDQKVWTSAESARFP
jgi:hypothetical protein